MNEHHPGTLLRAQVDGTQTTYRCWGDAAVLSNRPLTRPVVLLIHGGGSASTTWAHLASRLVDEGFLAVAPDLLGHGGAPRPRAYPLDGYAAHLRGLIERLQLDPFAIVGHSLGAYAAVLLAMRRPPGLRRLVLEDPPAPPASEDAAAPLRMPLSERIKVLLAAAVGRRRFAPKAITSAINQLSLPDDRWWQRWSQLNVSTLIVSGGPTSHIPVDRLERMAQRPGAELAQIDEGHRIHTGAPGAFADLVVPFLRR